MASIQVRVLDVSGSRICDVEAPDDVTVDRILVLMVEKMGLPLNSPDGQLMSYKLHHRRTGTQLLDNQTLLGAGVRAGDELRLQPEITAGSQPRQGRKIVALGASPGLHDRQSKAPEGRKKPLSTQRSFAPMGLDIDGIQTLLPSPLYSGERARVRGRSTKHA